MQTCMVFTSNAVSQDLIPWPTICGTYVVGLCIILPVLDGESSEMKYGMGLEKPMLNLGTKSHTSRGDLL